MSFSVCFTSEIAPYQTVVIPLGTKMQTHVDPYPQERTFPHHPSHCLMVLGSNGLGKSSTGNSILGIRRFDVSTDFSTMTTGCDFGTQSVDGRIIGVLDTPGFWCGASEEKNDCSLDIVMASLDDAFRIYPHGFQALVIVLKVGVKMTGAEHRVMHKMNEVLGGRLLQERGVIVFTGGDTFDHQTGGNVDFGRWDRERKGPTNEILQLCQYRCVLFDNWTTDNVKMKSQRFKLVKLVDEIHRHCKPFTRNDFELAKKSTPQAPPQEVDLLLIGKTGNGKSATGNSILGAPFFDVFDGLQTARVPRVTAFWERHFLMSSMDLDLGHPRVLWDGTDWVTI